MASASKRGKFMYEQVYEEDDLVDDFFFNELAKHIVPTKLASLVEHMALPEAKFDFLQDFLIQKTSVQWVSSTTCSGNVVKNIIVFIQVIFGSRSECSLNLDLNAAKI